MRPQKEEILDKLNPLGLEQHRLLEVLSKPVTSDDENAAWDKAATELDEVRKQIDPLVEQLRDFINKTPKKSPSNGQIT